MLSTKNESFVFVFMHTYVETNETLHIRFCVFSFCKYFCGICVYCGDEVLLFIYHVLLYISNVSYCGMLEVVVFPHTFLL